MPVTIPSVELQAILAALTTSGGEFDGARISFYSGTNTPSRTSVLGDFTAFSANGITANNAVTWGSVGVNDQGQAELLGNLQSQMTSNIPVPSATIGGYFVTDAGATKLLYAEAFSVPLTLSRANQPIAVIPRVTLDT